MESKIKQVDKLLEEGGKFTFDNFSIRSDPTFGGSDAPEWLAWKTRVRNIISQIVDEKSAPATLMKMGLTIGTKGNFSDKFEKQKELLLKALQQTIDITKDDIFNELNKPSAISSNTKLSNKVFVVHGHDNELKTEVELFLKGIGLEPIVLHRQPDQGRTIIEKIEKYSDVGYAFVLLTPDEIAYAIDQDHLDNDKRKKEFRARPNVIFEFGYFAAKLTRSRVCCIIKGDVSKPSDIDGLVYKKVQDSIESIAFSIIKELQAAGYEIHL